MMKLETDELFRERVFGKAGRLDWNSFKLTCISIAGGKTLDKFGDTIGLYRYGAEKLKEERKRWFVWFDAVKGNGYVYAAHYEAQIIEDVVWLPKNVVRKEEISFDDRRSIEELKVVYPLPAFLVQDGAKSEPAVYLPLEPLLISQDEMDVSVKKFSAKLQGYEGDACGNCGNFSLVRSGTCLRCDNCGTTTGCS